MPKRKLALWAAALCATATHVSAYSISRYDVLLSRQANTCSVSGFSPCQYGNFPNNFCCPAGQTCLALAGNTTILCCPNNVSCRRIAPIPCEISLQDVSKNPDAVIKTTALNVPLGKCANACCPFGYSCKDDECVMNDDQSKVPEGFKPSTTVALTPTSTSEASLATSRLSSTSTSPTSTAISVPAEDGGEEGKKSGIPVGAIAGGVTAAVVIIMGTAILACIFYRKRQAANSSPKSKHSYISAPIPYGETIRTDFNAKAAAKNANYDSEFEPDSVTGAVLKDRMTPSVSQGASPDMGNAYGTSKEGYGGYGGLGTTTSGDNKAPPRLEMPTFSISSSEEDNYRTDVSPLSSDGYSPNDTNTKYGPNNNASTSQQAQAAREPSSMTLPFCADPNITRDRTGRFREYQYGALPDDGDTDRKRETRMTTFTQMLESVDLGGVVRGEGYVPRKLT
ncbi:uncharacterized protein CTHT_0066840 [Thermochaetoides thermophila DSM 1495]|uniref:Mid2 domain-containing protein n=1 Tax=Chaetomium thermophilum (strain DSM 1495 / CBS 144.50 / IMI 039719) TaxID=759272 RepID=G0SGM2_CHATD|nr:hypothetical protein CTHT_0066840 [Thermochaetoides thermophila DSM 1495]EGS17361.1 hypothetical protein CTHT_0066840 [Thermochaetoides thermophila DSM 1495]